MKAKWKISDFLLSLCAAAALTSILFVGFVVPEDLRNNTALILFTAAVILLVLNVCFFNRLTIVISLSVAFVLVILYVLYLWFFVHFSITLDVTIVIPYLFILFVFGSALLTLFLSKTRIGIVLLFLTGVVISISLGSLGYEINIFHFFVFILCTTVVYFKTKQYKS